RSTETSSTAWMPPKAMEMLRISTSGVLAPVIMVLLLDPPAVDRIEPYGDDQHDTDNDVLQRRIHAKQDHARGERLHQYGADHGPGDGAHAAGQRRPADHGCGDHQQLVERAH